MFGARESNSSGLWASVGEYSGPSCDKRMNLNSSDIPNFFPKKRHERFHSLCAIRPLYLQVLNIQVYLIFSGFNSISVLNVE